VLTIMLKKEMPRFCAGSRRRKRLVRLRLFGRNQTDGLLGREGQREDRSPFSICGPTRGASSRLWRRRLKSIVGDQGHRCKFWFKVHLMVSQSSVLDWNLVFGNTGNAADEWFDRQKTRVKAFHVADVPHVLIDRV
jgi:hypothetical protein